MQSFLIALLTCTITMSVLVIFYSAIMPLLAKRYSAKGRYYAWLIIVIGLIIPFRPQFVNVIVEVDLPIRTVMPIMQETDVTSVAENALKVFQINNVTPPTLPAVSWRQIAIVIWILGMLAFLLCRLIKHYCFVKMANRWSERVTDEKSLSMLQALITKMGIKKNINLYLCSCIGSPMMIGFVKTRIFLPKADLAQDELNFILKHELIHYKRKDLLYKYMVLVAMAIHWFNPIVHLMSKAIEVLCEISCDADVVRSTDSNTRQHYSETIIGVVKYQSKLKTALSTNFFGGKKSMKKRIFSIMDTSSKKAGVAIICFAIVITLGTGFAFSVNAANPSSIGTTINNSVPSETVEKHSNQEQNTNNHENTTTTNETDPQMYNNNIYSEPINNWDTMKELNNDTSSDNDPLSKFENKLRGINEEQYESVIGDEAVKKFNDVFGDALGNDFIFPLDNNEYMKNLEYYGAFSVVADKNEEIYAMTDGKVIFADYLNGYGNSVIIEDNNKQAVIYGHCDSVNVKEGDYVSQSDIIGFVGSSGYTADDRLLIRLLGD